MALRYYGFPHTLTDIAKIAGTNEVFGTLHGGLVHAAQYYGLQYQLMYHATYADLCESIDRDSLVIIYTHWPDAPQKLHGVLDQMHYLLVVGYGKDEIIVHDSDINVGESNVAMSRQALDRHWRSERGSEEKWALFLKNPNHHTSHEVHTNQ